MERAGPGDLAAFETISEPFFFFPLFLPGLYSVAAAAREPDRRRGILQRFFSRESEDGPSFRGESAIGLRSAAMKLSRHLRAGQPQRSSRKPRRRVRVRGGRAGWRSDRWRRWISSGPCEAPEGAARRCS